MTEEKIGGTVTVPPNPPSFSRGGSTRIAVTVTFLRQDQRPVFGATGLPEDTRLSLVQKPTVAFYRFLYNTVGADYVWWLRRTVPDRELGDLLATPGIWLHVLYRGEETLGFFELDSRAISTVNISYFGLLPGAIGRGLGTALLRAAISTAWSFGPRAVTVNTCTADHPRALPNYLRAGFHIVRSAPEIWDVPNALGLRIPAHLKVPRL